MSSCFSSLTCELFLSVPHSSLAPMPLTWLWKTTTKRVFFISCREELGQACHKAGRPSYTVYGISQVISRMTKKTSRQPVICFNAILRKILVILSLILESNCHPVLVQERHAYLRATMFHCELKFYRAYHHPCCNLGQHVTQKLWPRSYPRNKLPQLATRLALRPITLFDFQCNIDGRQVGRNVPITGRNLHFLSAKLARTQVRSHALHERNTHAHTHARRNTYIFFAPPSD